MGIRVAAVLFLPIQFLFVIPLMLPCSSLVSHDATCLQLSSVLCIGPYGCVTIVGHPDRSRNHGHEDSPGSVVYLSCAPGTS